MHQEQLIYQEDVAILELDTEMPTTETGLGLGTQFR